MKKEFTDNIIELNRDMESFIIQGSATRSNFFKKKFEDKFVPLQFVHFSDIHAVLDLWNRIVEYINHYEKYISFGIHTGDYCGNNQQLFVDFYNYGTQCERPIYNCVGNHDTLIARTDWTVNPDKSETFKRLFAPMPDSSADVKFMPGEYSMTYFKDFPESNIRMIVLNLYYDIDEQTEWLKGLLTDAKEKGLSVITAMHEATAEIVNSFGVSFHTLNDYTALEGKFEETPFESIIADFINDGGEHICHLAGHYHHDLFGVTEKGVLNTVVPCATNWNGWCDGKREKGTRTYDCFNVVSVDTNLGLLKICRIGDNCDHYLREKKVLCFDFRNRKVIAN